MTIDFSLTAEPDLARVKIDAAGGVPGDAFFLLRRDRNGSRLVRETSEAGVVWQTDPASLRTNLSTNPSLEVAATGWGANLGTTGASTVQNLVPNPNTAPNTTNIEASRNRFQNTNFSGGSGGLPAGSTAYTSGTTVTASRSNTNLPGSEYISVAGQDPAARYGLYFEYTVSGSANVPVTFKADFLKEQLGTANAAALYLEFWNGSTQATDTAWNGGTHYVKSTADSGTLAAQGRATTSYTKIRAYLWIENPTGSALSPTSAAWFSNPIVATGYAGYNPETVKFYDGNTEADDDSTYSWAGTAYASDSIQTVQGLSQFTSNNVQALALSYTGIPAATVIGNSAASNDSYISVVGDSGALRMGMVASTTYTFKATASLPEAQTDTLNADARKIVVYTKVGANPVVKTTSSAAANAAGTTDLSVTFTVPASATEAYIRLYNGAFLGQGVVHWSNLSLTVSSYTGPRFTGDSQSDDYTSYTWDGAVNASSSTRTGITGRVTALDAPVGTHVHQQVWAIGSTTGSPGPYYQENVSGVINDVYSTRLMVKMNVARSIKLLLRYRNGGTTVNTCETAVIAVPANTWTEIPLEACRATGTFDNILLWVVAQTGSLTFVPGDWIRTDKVLLEKKTALKRNLCTNPSFEVDLAGWNLNGVTAIKTIGFPQMAHSGTGILQATSNGTSASPSVTMDNVVVNAGEWFGMKAWLASEFVGNMQVRIAVTFKDSGGASLSTVTSTYAYATFYTGAYHQIVTQAPASTAKATIWLQFQNGASPGSIVASGQRMWADVVQCHAKPTQAEVEATLAEGYFDGSTTPPAGKANGWSGTAHASESVQTTSLGVYFDGSTNDPAYSGWNGTPGSSTSYMAPDSLPITLYDYEARQGLDTSYILTDELGTVGAEESLLIPEWGTWIKDPFRPDANVKVLWNADSDYTRKARRSLFLARGAKFPVPQWDVRVAPAASIKVATETEAQAIAFTDLLATAGVVMIDTKLSFGVPVRYVSVGDIVGSRATAEAGLNLTWEARIWTLEIDEVDYPIGAPIGQGIDYTQVAGFFDSYIALASGVDTYADLASGNWG